MGRRCSLYLLKDGPSSPEQHALGPCRAAASAAAWQHGWRDSSCKRPAPTLAKGRRFIQRAAHPEGGSPRKRVILPSMLQKPQLKSLLQQVEPAQVNCIESRTRSSNDLLMQFGSCRYDMFSKVMSSASWPGLERALATAVVPLYIAVAQASRARRMRYNWVRPPGSGSRCNSLPPRRCNLRNGSNVRNLLSLA